MRKACLFKHSYGQARIQCFHIRDNIESLYQVYPVNIIDRWLKNGIQSFIILLLQHNRGP